MFHFSNLEHIIKLLKLIYVCPQDRFLDSKCEENNFKPQPFQTRTKLNVYLSNRKMYLMITIATINFYLEQDWYLCGI